MISVVCSKALYKFCLKSFQWLSAIGYTGSVTYCFSDRQHGGIQIRWTQAADLTFGQKWNPWCTDIPWVTLAHHPIIYNPKENETVTFNVDEFFESLLEATSKVFEVKRPNEKVSFLSDHFSVVWSDVKWPDEKISFILDHLIVKWPPMRRSVSYQIIWLLHWYEIKWPDKVSFVSDHLNVMLIWYKMTKWQGQYHIRSCECFASFTQGDLMRRTVSCLIIHMLYQYDTKLPNDVCFWSDPVRSVSWLPISVRSL